MKKAPGFVSWTPTPTARPGAEVESQLQRVQDFDSANASKVEVEAVTYRRMAADHSGEDFCQICNKRVGKGNWSSHIKGKAHCRKKQSEQMNKDKEKLLDLAGCKPVQPAKPQIIAGVKYRTIRMHPIDWKPQMAYSEAVSI